MMSARLLPKLIIVSLMILSAQSLALGQSRFRPPVFERDRPGYNFNSRPLVLKEHIYRDFRGNSKIDLKKLFRDPNIQYKGMSVESITMVASSSRGRAKSALSINGFSNFRCGPLTVNHCAKSALSINGFSNPADAQTVPTYAREMSFQVDPRRNVIGQHINSLDIEMRGNVFVESVEVVLSSNRRGGGRSEVFEQQFSDFINFGKNYKLRQQLGIGPRHNGKKVQFVEITGSSPSGSAYAQLLIEGRPVGRVQHFSRFQQALRFQMPYNQDVLGQDIQGFQIQVSGGGAHVTQIKVAVQSNRGGGPGRGSRVVEKNVDLHVTGQQSHSLQALIGRRGMGQRRVKTVEVIGRSRQGGGKVQLCQKRRWGQNDCQQSQTLQRSLTRRSFFSGDYLNEIELKTRGQVHIQKIVVTSDS